MIEPNSILLDKDTRLIAVKNHMSGRMRLYIGKFENGQFTQTVESIKFIDEARANTIRKDIRTFVKDNQKLPILSKLK